MPFAVSSKSPKRLALPACLAAALLLAACGDGGSSESFDQSATAEKAVLATRTIPVPPTPPVHEDGSSARPAPGVAGELAARRPAVSYVSDCVVDFTDAGALQLTEPSLWFDRIYLPWFQQCGGYGYVDVRPLVMEHVHISFADPAVVPCNTHVQAFPSRVDDVGNCELVDIPSEPRTHMTTHTGAEIVRIIAEKADHETRTAFDLNRIRIPGTQPVRLCYKKRTETSPGSWVTAEPATGSPGSWLCWNQLDPGTWDLSDWVWDVTEVKITGTPGVSVNFSLDDLHIGIR